jgi:homopolymeric O-antigen transport system ATP-binding protein
MESPVIRVENLSKKFILTHETQERYTSLRDVIAKRARALAGKDKKEDSGRKEEFFALKDVSFDVEQGDRIGIVGRNGAGKSTLLKILSRITEPSKGKITIRGRVASLLEVGTGFHPELTGRENVFLNGAILGMSRAEIKRKFDEIIDFAEIERFLDTPVKRYSSGMYVRLAFAVAAHLEPEILVVDEVLAVGDAEFQKKCLGKMNEVSKGQGRTVLFVSHNMAAVAQLCNKGILLHKGEIKTNGRIDAVLEDYTSLEKNLVEVYENDNPKDFYISRVKALNEDGVPAFKHSSKVAVEIAVRMPHKLNGLKLGVALNDKWKRKIFTTQYSLLESDISNGTVVKKMMIPSHLLISGSYSLDVASFIPNSTTYTYLQDICPFKIEDFESEWAIYNGADVGVLNINCEWL